MKKLISLGTLSKTLIFPFIIPLFNIFRSYLMDKCDEEVKNKSISKNVDIRLIYVLFIFFGETLNGILALIIYKQSQNNPKIKDKNNNKNILSINNNIILVQNKKNKKNISKIIIILVFIIIIDTTSMTYNFIFLKREGVSSNNEMIFQIFFSGLFCKYFINYSFQKHHYFGMILVLFGIIFLNLHSLTSYNENLFYHIVIFILCIFSSLQEVLEKYLMDFEYIYPLTVVFYEGCLGILFLLLIYLFVKILSLNILIEINDAIYESLNGDFLFYFYILLLILSSSAINAFFMLTNYYYSPTHRNISDSVYYYYYYIERVLTGKNIQKEIIYLMINIIGLIFIIFGCLIYNEIIICHFCNFDLNTGEQINKRSKLETNIINYEIGKIVNEQDE